MPFAENNGVKIRFEVEGSGTPLILMHGLGGRVESWRLAGWIEPLAENFQLILIDARGHGLSDKSNLPEDYTSENRVGDVTAVLDDLGIAEAHYFGYSMGGQIGFDLALLAPQRISSFVFAGSGLRDPNPDAPPITREMLVAISKAALARDYLVESARQTHAAFVLENRAETLDAVRVSNTKRDLVKLRNALAQITQPTLFYAGTKDPIHDDASRDAARCRNGRFHSLEGLDHSQEFWDLAHVLPIVENFLNNADN